MKWTNFMLPQLLSILASVHCIQEHDLYPFSEVLNDGMDNDTNPCNDFYQYACGKWIERNEIIDIFDKWSVEEMTELSTVILIKEILEDPNIDESNNELSVEKKFYEACMDEDYSRKEGQKLLLNIFVGTPWTSLQNIVEYYASFSAFDLFHIKLNQSNYLQVEIPRFSESNRKPFADIINEITDRVKWLYKFANTSIDIPLINPIDETLDFIKSVNEIIWNSEEDIQTVNILQLQELYDSYCPSKHTKIEWLQFFKSLAKGTRAVFTKYSRFNVDVQYLKDLCELIIETPQHAIVNYLQYNFMFNDDTASYFRVDSDQMSYTERYIHCIQNLKITEGITKEMIKSHIPQKSQEIVHEMFNNIKSAMIKEIENSWLVNSVKEIVLIIAQRIEYRYGIIDDPFETKFGKKITYEFEVGRIAFQNELNLKRAQIINILQAYEEAYKLHRGKRSIEVNACYYQAVNKLVIGFALTLPPFFYENAPIGFNYGRLGFTIGHEMSHAFDFEILQCIIQCIPSKREREKMESMLESRKNCFVNQSNSFRVDGLRTLDENVADTQGLKLAWKAMNAVIKDQTFFKHQKQKKLFFLSFANQWCSNPEYWKNNPDDEHSPYVIRALGTLKNMNEFAKTYHCTNETLTPITKCDWWTKSLTRDIKNMSEKLMTFLRQLKI